MMFARHAGVLLLVGCLHQAGYGVDASSANADWTRYLLTNPPSVEDEGLRRSQLKKMPELTAQSAPVLVRAVLDTAIAEQRLKADTAPDLDAIINLIVQYRLAREADLAAVFIEAVLASPLDKDGYCIENGERFERWMGCLVNSAPAGPHVGALVRQLIAISLPEAYHFSGNPWPVREQFALDPEVVGSWLWIIDDQALRARLLEWSAAQEQALAVAYPPKEASQFWDITAMDQAALARAAGCSTMQNVAWSWKHWDQARDEINATPLPQRSGLLAKYLVKVWLKNRGVPPSMWLKARFLALSSDNLDALVLQVFQESLSEVPVVVVRGGMYATARSRALEDALDRLDKAGIKPTENQITAWRTIADEKIQAP